jgi:hypothetical protein
MDWISLMTHRILAWLSAFVGLCSPVAIGADAAVQLVFRQADGATETRAVTLVADGVVQHLRVSKQAIPAGTRHVEVHHPMATAKAGEDGFYVLSNGMYGTFRERPNAAYRNPHVVMPVFGVSTPRGAMTVIVTGLRYEAFQMVDLKGGIYRVFPRFELNDDAPDDDLAIEFHRVAADHATYADLAKVYRQFQLDRQVVRPLKERLRDNSELAYAAGSIVVRVRMGWKPVPSPVPEQNAQNEPPMKVAVSFDRLMKIIDEFKQQGIERAEFCLVGWNIGGHDGRYPQIFPVDQRLGGENKLRKAIAKAQDAGYQIVCHTNYSDAYRASQIGGLWDEDYLLRARDGATVKGGDWGGGTTYQTCPQCMYERFSRSDFARIRDLGFRGLHYIDVYSTVNPRTCYSPNHPLTKEGFAHWTRRMGADAQQTFGGFASEGGFDYAVSHLDYGLYISFYVPGSPTPALIDRHVPFWQLVYHGIVLSTPYTATTNYTIKDPQIQLKLIEFGGRPMFYFHSRFRDAGTHWMGNDDLSCATDDELVRSVALVKRGFDEFETLRHLQLEFMESHSPVADQVFKTTFSDGTSIVSNYGDADWEYRGRTIKSMGYLVVKE